MTMIRPYVPVLRIEEPVEVPLAEQMDNETFIKHLEYRHAQDCGFEQAIVSRDGMVAWIGAYRAFHDRLHTLAIPGQYDHVHVHMEEEE
jgi:hypothetical protein